MGSDSLWEAVGAIGEVLGAVGVIFSLVYLAGQIRLNTMAIRGSSSFQGEAAYAQTNEQMVAYPDELKQVFIRAYTPEADLAELTETERLTVGLHMRSILQKCSAQYYLYKNGLIDDDLWHARLRWASGFIRLPAVATWWASEKAQGQFAPQFIEMLESYDAPVDVTRPGVDY